MAIALSQAHYRFGKDDGTESTHTWYAPEDSPASLPLDTNILLRICVQESGGTAAPNLVQQFQYSTNGTTWSNVTTVINNAARAVAVNAFTNGQNCTKRLSGTGTFESSAAGCTEDGNSGGSSNDVAASGNTETELGFMLLTGNIAPGAPIYFRLTVSGPTTSITYTVTPTAHVMVTKAPALNGAVLAGQAPNRVVNYIAAVAVGALSMAGLQPTATVEVPNITKSPPAASLAVTGDTPRIPTLTVEVREGATVRATRYIDLTSALATTEIALSTAERNAIGNWSGLYLAFIANSGQVEVTWADLKAPVAESGATIEAPTVGALALAGLVPTVAQTAPDVSKSPPVGTLAFAGLVPTAGTFGVNLYCGATLIAARAVALSPSLTTYTFDLSTDERNAIADWADLRVALVASGSQAEVTWVDLVAPEAAVAQNPSPPLGAMALQGQGVVVYGSAPHTASPDTGTLSLVGTVSSESLVQLWMGPRATGTLITSRRVAFTPTFTTYDLILTDDEFDAITAWSDLHVVVIADAVQLFVSWVQLQTPERGASPGAGALTFLGRAPLPSPLKAGVPASVAIAGTVPTLDRTFTVTPPTGTLAVTGTPPIVIALVHPLKGSLALTGQIPTLARSEPYIQIPVEDGTLALAGVAPTVFVQQTVAPGVGTLAVAGVIPTTASTFLTTPAAAALTLAGTTPLASVSSPVDIIRNPEDAHLILTGLVPSIVQAAIGPVALCWGSEALVAASLTSEILVSAGITDDTLECVV